MTGKRTRGTRLSSLSWPALLVALSASAYACGDMAASSFEAGDPGAATNADGGGSRGDSTSPAPAGELAPTDNGVILVHAAKALSFRLCFGGEAELDRRPLPDSQLMPEANVVGVEVGNAVRVPPLNGAPGTVYLFEEPLIRELYPQFGTSGTKQGPTCRQLLSTAGLSNLAVELGPGPVTTDLSQGVHLLVVKGCAANSALRKYSVEECGPSWTPDKGSLSVQEISLTGARRPETSELPVQVVNLSQPLERARAGRDVVVTFGDLTTAGVEHATVVTNPPLFGGAVPTTPAKVTYASGDTAIYDSVGFRVQLEGEAGAPATVLTESLARIQKQSSSRDVPPTYYAVASNYALLLLGDPAATLADGGRDEDKRRNLHILAVPVVDPETDGGPDSGEGEPLDGGSAPP